MIPKVIHYVWFGKGEMNALHRRCIDTWRRVAPDFELRLWNEDNSDIDNEYCRAAIKARKWAFVSDWVRFDVLYKEGGIYLDTDMELVRPLDPLLDSRNAVVGWESRRSIGTAFLLAPPQHQLMDVCRQLILHDLQPRKAFATSPDILRHAVSKVAPDSYTLLPREVFFPFNPYERDDPNNAGQFMFNDVKPETIGIHHFRLEASWSDTRTQRLLRRALGKLKIAPAWGTIFNAWPNPSLK